jgi:PASTA domain
MSNDNEKVKVPDEQTGKEFILVPEHWLDIIAAWVSISYTLVAIAYLGWLLLDTWTGEYSAWFMRPYQATLKNQDSTVFKLVVYTAVGGGMGAAVNNVRSFVQWHAERKAFGWRFVWKYISLLPLGATLAVMVYAIIRGGIAMFSGGGLSSSGPITSFTAWATGTLAGYGAHKVFIWLDDKVSTMFKVEAESSQAAKVAVPNLSGKNPEEAKQTLQESKLTLGDVSDGRTSDGQMIGKVIGQTPVAGTEVAPDSKVAITIGKANDGE